jgi:hypothetical protein
VHQAKDATNLVMRLRTLRGPKVQVDILGAASS